MPDNENPIQELSENTKNGKTWYLWFRTILYIVCFLGAIISYVLNTYHYDQLSQIIGVISAFLSSSFGIIYNPIRLK